MAFVLGICKEQGKVGVKSVGTIFCTGRSERIAEGMGLPGFGFEFLNFNFFSQCNRVPDERRYLLPLKSNYMRQIDRMVGLI